MSTVTINRAVVEARRTINRYNIIRTWDSAAGAAANEYLVRPAGYNTVIARLTPEHGAMGCFLDLKELVEAIQLLMRNPPVVRPPKRAVRKTRGKSARRK